MKPSAAWSALAYRPYRADPAAPGPAPAAPAPGGSAAPPAQGPAAAPKGPPQPVSPPPALLSGEVKIEDLGHAFRFPPPATSLPIPARDDVRSGFSVTAQNVRLAAPPGVFTYGLVQNLMMDHYEASYGTGCDAMVPVAGPLLDIDQPPDPGPLRCDAAEAAATTTRSPPARTSRSAATSPTSVILSAAAAQDCPRTTAWRRPKDL